MGVLGLLPDQRPVAGAGHLARCLALGMAWRESGGSVTTADTGLDSLWADRYRDAGVLAGEPTTADWTVIDDYRVTSARQTDLRERCHRLALIDDHGAGAPYDADLVIDQNIGARTAPGVACAVGTKFAMLRPEFRIHRCETRSFDGPARRLLVSLGGSPSDSTLIFIDAVCAALRGRLELIRLSGKSSSVAEQMASADLALAASGSSAYELACVGTPSILLALAENQVPVGERMHEAGGARYLGRIREITPAVAAAAVLELSSRPEDRCSLARVGYELVDGRGAARVVARLRSRELELRDARPEDVAMLWEWANDDAVRAGSFHPEPIAWQSHCEWFDDCLANSECVILIAHLGGDAIGQIRFNIEGSAAKIGYSIVAERRGEGLGAPLLMAGLDALEARRPGIVAVGVIRDGNMASIRAFEQAAFHRLPTSAHLTSTYASCVR